MPSKQPKPRLVDITIRITRKDGKPTTETDARKALWAAHEIVSRGGSLRRQFRDWEVHAINWRNSYASGKTLNKTYTEDIDEVLRAMGPILESVGIESLRVAPHTAGD